MYANPDMLQTQVPCEVAFWYLEEVASIQGGFSMRPVEVLTTGGRLAVVHAAFFHQSTSPAPSHSPDSEKKRRAGNVEESGGPLEIL